MQAKIFSAEVLLDVLYIIHILSISSETAKVKNFINRYIDPHKKVIKPVAENQHFEAQFNDLIGANNIFNIGMVEKYNPIQVVY